jgi:hypothetical protein
MYIHRIVIDANRINAKGELPGMNYLESLRQAGLVEIHSTSTLASDMPLGRSEMSKKRHKKGASYPRIGGGMVYLTPDSVPDSHWGTAGRPSRFTEIQNIVFGHLRSRESVRLNDQRDALHIDQANQHDADFFLTVDALLQAAADRLQERGFPTRVCSDDEGVAAIKEYFNHHYKTTEPAQLAALLKDCGPIFIGSNSCGDTSFRDVTQQEELLGFDINEQGVGVFANIRGKSGDLLLTVSPGKPLHFLKPGLSVTGESDPKLPAAIRIGETTCSAFVIGDKATPTLAGRMLSNNRLMIYGASLYSASGREALAVNRGELMLSGVSCSIRVRQ